MNLSEKYAIVQKYSRRIGGIYLSTCDLDRMATSRWSELCSVLIENKSPSRPPSPGKAHRRILSPLPPSISIADLGLFHVSPQLHHRSCIIIPSAFEIGIHCRRGLGRNRPSPPSPGATAEYRAEEGKGAAMMAHSLSFTSSRKASPQTRPK